MSCGMQESPNKVKEAHFAAGSFLLTVTCLPLSQFFKQCSVILIIWKWTIPVVLLGCFQVNLITHPQYGRTYPHMERIRQCSEYKLKFHVETLRAKLFYFSFQFLGQFSVFTDKLSPGNK